jgi:hypothetical protein
MDCEQEREAEQFKFIQSLGAEMTKNTKHHGRDYYNFAMEISSLILQFLRYGPELFGEHGESNTGTEPDVKEQFMLALGKISEFKRVESEISLLLEMLLRQFLIPVYSFCRLPYLREGAKNPQKVYGAVA